MFKIPTEIQYILDILNENGYEAYLVGGCVRDLLLNKAPCDFDIATSALPNEVCDLFEHTAPTGIKHGTVTVIVGKTAAEVTTFRTEGDYSDCRHPTNVSFVKTVQADLSRRDFTVNAIAYNPKCGIVDPFCGQADIKAGLLRAVGKPEKRFCEDALRILRLFRFASTLNFKIETDTLAAALENSHLLCNVSRERIFAELKKAVTGKNFACFALLLSTGSLEFLKLTRLPDFKLISKFSKNKRLALFAFLHLAGQNSLFELKPSRAEREYFKQMQLLLSLAPPKTKAAIKRMLSLTSPTIVSDYFEFNLLEGTPLSEVLASCEPYKISDLKINGDDLLQLGFSGAEIKKTLEALLCLVIENPQKNNKADLLNNIK